MCVVVCFRWQYVLLYFVDGNECCWVCVSKVVLLGHLGGNVGCGSSR